MSDSKFKINPNFIAILQGLADKEKDHAVNIILSHYEAAACADDKFYEIPAQIKKVKDKLIDAIDTTDEYLGYLIKLEAVSPFSIFKYILDENFSDILIHHDGLRLSDDIGHSWVVPPKLYIIYNKFIDHLIQNVKFLDSKKFDPANWSIDAEIQGMRFNMTHSDVVASGRPVLAIRKNLSGKTFEVGESYINSIDASEDQIRYIKQFAFKGGFIIFGEVGSGKTTLLKYMGLHRLEDKNNLCTIEDTKELNIPVPLAEITNQYASIYDLFINALRQNPSHVIIGETRTEEIVDIMENALTINVGTTIHAASFPKAIQRIAFMSLKKNIPASDIMNLTSAAIDCFILMEKRKVKGMWIHSKEMYSDIYKCYQEIE